MAKKIEFENLSLDDVRQINNTLLQDLVSTARAGKVGFGGAKGKDHVEGGWTRGGDHVKGGWTRGAAAFELTDIINTVSGAGAGEKK